MRKTYEYTERLVGETPGTTARGIISKQEAYTRLRLRSATEEEPLQMWRRDIFPLYVNDWKTVGKPLDYSGFKMDAEACRA